MAIGARSRERNADALPAIVVTGAYGFLGSHVVREAAKRGLEVIAVGRRAPSAETRGFVDEVLGHVTYDLGDVVDARWAATLPGDRVVAVINVAAVTTIDPREELEQAGHAAAVNVTGAANVARWTIRSTEARLIHVSSGAVYGPSGAKRAVEETVEPRPASVYGITKLAGERLVQRLCGESNRSHAIARLTNVYGPMEVAGESRAVISDIATWSESARAGEPLYVPNPDRRRDYVYVADAASAVVDLALAPSVKFPIFNVASGVDISDREVASTIAGLCDTTIVIGAGGDLGYRPRLAIDRIQSLGWRPTVNLSAGLQLYHDWLAREQRLLPQDAVKSR
jgi:nucleoside-diphosphate-sugar epimerase